MFYISIFIVLQYYDVNSVCHQAHFYAYWWGFPLRSLNIYSIEIELQSFPVSALDIVSENSISTFNLLNFDSYKIVGFRLEFWVSSFNVPTTWCAGKNYLKWGSIPRSNKLLMVILSNWSYEQLIKCLALPVFAWLKVL